MSEDLEGINVGGLAKQMFDAYNAEGPNPGKTWDGRDVPPFGECGEQVQGKWKAAARCAIRALREQRAYP